MVGQFGGRNLLGDLPDSPGQSRWDFVLRSADAAIWVTNLRPRGKDFELCAGRADTPAGGSRCRAPCSRDAVCSG